MTPQRQQIRFIQSHDGVRLAYALAGQGPLLVKAATWLAHVEYDLNSPVWGHMVRSLSALSTFVRCDERGCGLSDRAVQDLSFESRVRDLELLIETLDAERVSLLGMAHGAPVAIAFAARHPERVSHLVIHGGYARGWKRRHPEREQCDEFELMLRFAELGWRKGDHAFHQFFSGRVLPGGTPEQQQWLNELRQLSTTSEDAVRFIRQAATIDVSGLLGQVRCPTLVLHNVRDRSQPSTEGRFLAAHIPGARFVPIHSGNSLPLEQDPGWPQWLEAVRSFLPTAAPLRDPHIDMLTPRERELLNLLAQGRDNAQIAALLGLSDKTVRNHLTRVFAKLEVDNRGRAIVLARDSGFGALQA